MVKIDQNNYFTDFIENFAASQGNSEKNTIPVKKTRKRTKLVRDGCSHFFFVSTDVYLFRKNKSTSQELFFWSPEFFLRRINELTENKGKGTMPIKIICTHSISVRNGWSHFLLLTHTYIKSEKMSPPQKNFFSGHLNFLNAGFINAQKILKNLIK